MVIKMKVQIKMHYSKRDKKMHVKSALLNLTTMFPR